MSYQKNSTVSILGKSRNSKISPSNMQKTLREYRNMQFNIDYANTSQISQGFISKMDSGLLVDDVNLSLNENHCESRVVVSPDGDTKFYAQSIRFYSGKRRS